MPELTRQGVPKGAPVQAYWDQASITFCHEGAVRPYWRLGTARCCAVDCAAAGDILRSGSVSCAVEGHHGLCSRLRSDGAQLAPVSGEATAQAEHRKRIGVSNSRLQAGPTGSLRRAVPGTGGARRCARCRALERDGLVAWARDWVYRSRWYAHTGQVRGLLPRRGRTAAHWCSAHWYALPRRVERPGTPCRSTSSDAAREPCGFCAPRCARPPARRLRSLTGTVAATAHRHSPGCAVRSGGAPTAQLEVVRLPCCAVVRAFE